MVQNLMPVKSDSDEQSGHGSVELAWHTEDAFHPNRCDYLLLAGIRNHDQVPTTFSDIFDLNLSDSERQILAQRRFSIRPDNEHIRQLQQIAPESAALKNMLRMRDTPEPCAVLFGETELDSLRIDPYFMETIPGNEYAENVLTKAISQLDAAQTDVVIHGGDLAIVNNHKAVHGRRSYSPRFDGTDRWLKKISVSAGNSEFVANLSGRAL